MSVFDRVFARYDVGMAPLEWLVLRRLRRRIYPTTRGRALELGVGTGVNLPHYPPQVDLAAIDLSAAMLRVARRRPVRARVLWVQADVERLPFADGDFAQVLCSLLLCSVRDPAQALAEMHRVLAPGGCLVALEHVRGERGVMRLLTDWLDRPWYRLNGSCHLNRDTAQAVQACGFQIVRSNRHALGLFQVIIARKPA